MKLVPVEDVKIHSITVPDWKHEKDRDILDFFHYHPAHLLAPEFLCNKYQIRKLPLINPCYVSQGGVWIYVQPPDGTLGPYLESSVHIVGIGEAGFTLDVFEETSDEEEEEDADIDMGEGEEETKDDSFLYTSSMSRVTVRHVPIKDVHVFDTVNKGRHIVTMGEYVRIKCGQWCYLQAIRAMHDDDHFTQDAHTFSIVTFEEKFADLQEDPGPLTIYTRVHEKTPQARCAVYRSGRYRIPSARHRAVRVIQQDYADAWKHAKSKEKGDGG